MTAVLHEIVEPSDPLLAGYWLPLYRESFPADERVDESEHVEAATALDKHLLVALRDGQPVGIARYDVMASDDVQPYAYLMYMAVDPSAVSHGHGRRMFSEIVLRAEADPASPVVVLLEVQDPAHGHSTAYHQLPRRRIDFYRRQGCRLLEGVRYLQTVGSDQPPVPMLIMARPLTEGVTAEAVFVAARELFGDDVQQTGALVLTDQAVPVGATGQVGT